MTEEAAVASERLAHCWNCGVLAAAGALCPGCDALQPFSRRPDHFSVFGLERHLALCPEALEQRFHELSRRYHPDLQRGAGSRERLIALENASRVNQAYRALREPLQRAAHLVELEGGADAEPAPPSELFEEILEIGELMDALEGSSGSERERTMHQLQEHHRRLTLLHDAEAERLTMELFPKWDQAVAHGAERAELAAEMARMLNERAYLRRLLDRLNEILSPDERASS